MSNKPHKVPKRRFKRFLNAGDWEQRKAKELCSITTGKSNTQDQVESGKYPFFIRSDVPVRSDKYLYDCEAVITIGDGEIGKVFHYINGKFDLHQRCYKMTDFRDVLGRYFYYFFSTKFYERAMKMTAKATVDSVRLEMISEMDIVFPVSLQEQQQIAAFFSYLDNLITLHQRKLNKLKSLKSAYLSELFPKKGETNPSLRFSEFTDDWEQRKLVELCKSITYGLNVRAKIFDGKHKYLRITDIDDETRTFSTDNLTSPDCSLTKLTAYQLQEGDLVFSRTGASVGKTYVYQPSDGLVYHAGFLIRARILPDQNHHLIYQLTLTRNFRDYVLVTSQRLGQPGINAREYGAYQMVIPEVLEQNRLSNFLYSFDNLITLHQRKLEKLKNLKKAYLNELFV